MATTPSNNEGDEKMTNWGPAKHAVVKLWRGLPWGLFYFAYAGLMYVDIHGTVGDPHRHGLHLRDVLVNIPLALFAAIAIRAAVFGLFAPLFKRLELSNPAKTADKWRDIYLDAANDCDVLAKYHDDKGRYFLVSGLVVALLGVAYFLVILFRLPLTDAAPAVDAIKSLEISVNSARDTEDRIDRRAIPKQDTAEKKDADLAQREEELEHVLARINIAGLSPDALNDFAAVELNGKELVQQLMESRTGLRNQIEKDKELKPAIADVERSLATVLDVVNSKKDYKQELLQTLRSATGFLFIEIIAGFLLALSQRNDAQASYWRSHRQVYDRLLSTPEYIEELKAKGAKEPFGLDWLEALLTPVPLHVIGAKDSANPMLALVKQLADAVGAQHPAKPKDKEKG